MRLAIILVLLSAVLAALLAANIVMGSAEVSRYISPAVVWQVLVSHIPALHIAPLPPAYNIAVWESRVPRALAGVAIGMLLAMAGVAFQSFLMNPLADPYMVGVSAGSALGSAFVILAGGAAWLSGYAEPIAAFAAGIVAMLCVTATARINGRLSAQTFLLAGFVIGMFLYSLTRLAVALAERQNETSRANEILSQLLGSLEAVDWRSLALLVPFGLVGGVLLFRSIRELNLMALGEESAAHLGVDTEGFKRRIIVAGSLVTSATVAVAGIIGFVGMVVPHLARRLVGPDHRRLLPVAMLIGGIVLVAADWLSRVFLGGLEVGVVTSLFGAPVFCYILRSRLVSRW